MFTNLHFHVCLKKTDWLKIFLIFVLHKSEIKTNNPWLKSHFIRASKRKVFTAILQEICFARDAFTNVMGR